MLIGRVEAIAAMYLVVRIGCDPLRQSRGDNQRGDDRAANDKGGGKAATTADKLRSRQVNQPNRQSECAGSPRRRARPPSNWPGTTPRPTPGSPPPSPPDPDAPA